MPDRSPVLDLEGLTYRYPEAGRDALSEVSLAVRPGEFVALAGRSGSGKSTLLRAACALVPHFHGGEIAGRIEVAGLDAREHGPAELAGSVGFLAQDPESQIVSTTVRAEIALPLELRGTSPVRARSGGRGGGAGARDPRPARPLHRHAVRRRAAAGSARCRPGRAPRSGAARRADLAARPGRGRRAGVAAAPPQRAVGDRRRPLRAPAGALPRRRRPRGRDAGRGDRLRRPPARASSNGHSPTIPRSPPRARASSTSPGCARSRSGCAMRETRCPSRSAPRTAKSPPIARSRRRPRCRRRICGSSSTPEAGRGMCCVPSTLGVGVASGSR